ncbi:MAG: HD domain-containing protein [Candidatus Bathyarchaeota archaeon]|nr:HD domain-containing protein [Candidatus Bathyarchaeota archaeon]
MKLMNSSEIKALPDGTPVEAFLQCRTKSRRIVATGKGEIFAGDLGDNSGEIKFVAFSGSTIDCKALDDSIDLGAVVHVKGVKNTHQGFPQIVFSSRDGGSMRPALPGEYDLASFVPKTNQDVEAMWGYVTSILSTIKDPSLKSLVDSFTVDTAFVSKFKIFYGARMFHHSCAGGLLEHTWEVIQYCEQACKIHPSLDRDLVYAGAFLHDVGVLRENAEPLGMTESKEGFMLGHVYLSAEAISAKISAIPGFPEATRVKLLNLILSHQRKEEESDFYPRTPESVVMACADAFGVKVSQYIRVKKDSAGADWRASRAPIGGVYTE